MHEPLKERGIWWLPHDPERRLHGSLCYDPVKGTSLDLEGLLADHPFDQATEHIEVIHGELADGDPASLHTCDRGDVKWGKGIPNVRYHCERLLIGDQVNSLDDLPIHRVEVRYSNLAEWVNSQDFIIKSDGLGDYHITLEKPSERTIAITPRFEVAIASRVSAGSWSVVQKDFRVQRDWS